MTNDQNTTTLAYEGNIEMSIVVKGKKYTLDMLNNGTTYLKYCFARAMTNDLDKWNTPGYITLVKEISDGETVEEKMQFDKDIALSASDLVDSVDGYPTAVTFTAYISYDALVELIDAGSTDTYYFYLLSHDDSTLSGVRHLMAKFKVLANVLSYITPGTTATLNWTMKIINKGEV